MFPRDMNPQPTFWLLDGILSIIIREYNIGTNTGCIMLQFSSFERKNCKDCRQNRRTPDNLSVEFP